MSKVYREYPFGRCTLHAIMEAKTEAEASQALDQLWRLLVTIAENGRKFSDAHKINYENIDNQP